MSGQAGWTHLSRCYSLTLVSGMSAEVADPGDNHNYVADYFDHANRAFATWAESAAVTLDPWFEALAKSDWFPLAPLDLERALVVELSLPATGPSASMRLCVSRDPSPQALSQFTDKVSAIVQAARPRHIR